MTSKLLPLALYTACSAPATLAQDCPRLDDQKLQEVEHYLQYRYHFPPGDELTVATVSPLQGTCYRKITFESRALKRSITVYLSPDQLYLFPQVMDLRADPREEERKIAAERQAALLADSSPSRGGQERLPSWRSAPGSKETRPFGRHMISFSKTGKA